MTERASAARLIVQPEDGLGPVLGAIRSARRALDVAIFRLRAGEVVDELHAAVARGVEVRALVASRADGEEAHLREAEDRLLEGGVTVARTADDLVRYHAKYLIVDGRLFVLGFNFTKDNVEKRSLGIETGDAAAVREADRLFASDVARRDFVPDPESPLLVSPESSRTRLDHLLAGATRSLVVYDKHLRDPAFVRLIRACAARGVDVRVIGRAPALEGHVPVRALRGLKLHVRAVVRDEAVAFVGSQGLRTRELDQRRELGLLTSDPNISASILHVFEQDWERSEPAGDQSSEARTLSHA